MTVGYRVICSARGEVTEFLFSAHSVPFVKEKKCMKGAIGIGVWVLLNPTTFPNLVASLRGEKHELELNPDLQHSSRDLLALYLTSITLESQCTPVPIPAVVSNAGWCPLSLRETLKQRSSFSTSWDSCCVGPRDAISCPTTGSLFWCWQVPWHITHRTDGYRFRKLDSQMMA